MFRRVEVTRHHKILQLWLEEVVEKERMRQGTEFYITLDSFLHDNTGSRQESINALQFSVSVPFERSSNLNFGPKII